MSKKFTLCYTLEVTLDADDLWPDGDAPEKPTVKDVEGLIDSDGGFAKIIEEWGLEDCGEFAVMEEDEDP